MKYNRSEIMKAAWNLVKTSSMTISSALKAAWASAKVSSKVIANGSEKQNAWAADIVSRPVARVIESIARQARNVSLGYAEDAVVIDPLYTAIAMYIDRLNKFSADLTARFCIDYRDQFSRMMYNFVVKAFRAAGLKHNPNNFCYM